MVLNNSFGEVFFLTGFSFCFCKDATWSFVNQMGVSKNRGTPKWMAYNGTARLKWMIWGETPLFLVQHPNEDHEFSRTSLGFRALAWLLHVVFFSPQKWYQLYGLSPAICRLQLGVKGNIWETFKDFPHDICQHV